MAEAWRELYNSSLAINLPIPNYAYSLLGVPLALIVYNKIFPDHAKKLNKKFNAWICYKVMKRVHAKCSDKKQDLFQILQQFKVCYVLMMFSF